MKFPKKIDESSSTDIHETTNVGKTNIKDNEQQTPSKHMRVHLTSLLADPGQRPSIDHYHVNQRDEIRGHYCKKDHVNLGIILSYQKRLEVEFVNSILLGLMIINIG